MQSLNRSGAIVAIFLLLVSTTAVAQQRTPNTPDSPEVLNAESSGFISTPDGGEAVSDGSFEAGSPNPFWNEASTNFGTPLCTAGGCGTGGGTGPRTGIWWAWFGGINAFEEGSVSQAVTFPADSATLSFWFEAPACFSASDYLEVLVDGNQEFFADGTYGGCGMVGYLEQVVDLSAYADGGVHTIEFHSEIFGGGGGSNFFVDDVSLIGGAPPPLARFLVSKNFDDDNTAEVEVTLSCNTGLPLEQTTTIAEGDPVNFVIGDFEQGTLNCVVTEVVPGGYTASYDDGTVSDVNCSWEALQGGQYFCAITNSLDQVEIEVTKVWIDENPQFAAQNVADATWSCSNVAFGQNNGLLQFFGNPGEDSFFVFPDWDTGTTCSITEVQLNESGVEVDDSDCDGLVVLPGVGASCTIFNTRLFEGIPTLSQYGLGVLALLMLGVGFVAFRRLI